MAIAAASARASAWIGSPGGSGMVASASLRSYSRRRPSDFGWGSATRCVRAKYEPLCSRHACPARASTHRDHDDVSRFDLDRIWRWLSGSYWATGIPRALVERSIRGALCFGSCAGSGSSGLPASSPTARRSRTSPMCSSTRRARPGLATRLMRAILAHPDLQGLRRWLLATRDAHRLYAGAGFRPLAHPEWFMEITRPGLYQARAARVRSSRRASRASG